jgi:lipoate-protein ligase A
LQALSGPLHGESPELAWLAAALDGQPRAVWWNAAPGLVAPMSYRRHATLDSTMADFAARGLPVRLRRSGGGVVPQGPGICNLSLVYPLAGGPGVQAAAVYEHLCVVMRRALAALGIAAHAQEVQGSFCDGRYNLAVPRDDGSARKICGTAQYWKRDGARHAVLAHALVLVHGDLADMTDQANAFELALGSGRCYRADALTSVADERLGRDAQVANQGALAGELRAAIAHALLD